MKTLLAVAAAGAVGCAGRYAVVSAVARFTGGAFPWGTLLVNVLGSFLLGIVAGLSLDGGVSPRLKAALGTGLLGGFTTFSALSVETLGLFEEGLWLQGAGNIAISLGLGLPAAILGLWVGRSLG